MTNNPLSLASEFPQAEYEDWLTLIEKQATGTTSYEKLVSETYDAITIRPLYDNLTQHCATPGNFPYTRSTDQKINTWAIAQQYAHPDIVHSNALILDDLSKGVTHIRLLMSANNCNAKATESDNRASSKGLECYGLDDLDSLLQGVKLEWVPTEIHAGGSFLEYATAFMALCNRRSVDCEKIDTAFNADPVSVFADSGNLPANSRAMLRRLAILAESCSKQYPKVRAAGVSGAVFHNAGASQAQEIGIMLAAGVAYIRAMTAHGIDINTACTQIRFRMTVDAEYFQSIAKFRSIRELWAQICQHCGANEHACKIDLHGETSFRMQSKRDPWVNILRTTVASCAAAIGGAKSITCLPLDQAMGHPSKLARRISRNTQLLLQDESAIHQIIDPIGGSYFIEDYTEKLSEKAWEFFQKIESKGGIFNSLQDGSLQSDITEIRERRIHAIETRRQPLTGVTEFADLFETELITDPADIQKIRKNTLARTDQSTPAPTLESDNPDITTMVEALEEGVSTPGLSEQIKGHKHHCTQLKADRLASQFEALRESSDVYFSKHGVRPAVFVITIGSSDQYSSRLGYIKNFFAAGGIDINPYKTTADMEVTARSWQNSALPIVVLCSNDENYERLGIDIVKSLRNANAQHLYLAGSILPNLIDVHLSAGCKALDILKKSQKILGVV